MKKFYCYLRNFRGVGDDAFSEIETKIIYKKYASEIELCMRAVMQVSSEPDTTLFTDVDN